MVFGKLRRSEILFIKKKTIYRLSTTSETEIGILINKKGIMSRQCGILSNAEKRKVKQEFKKN